MSTMNVQKPLKPIGGFARGMGRFRGFREGTTILIILVLGVVMSLLSPVFLTGENFSTMFKIFAINGLVVIGMTLVMIGGGIDLSVAAVMALVGVVAGQLFLVYHWDIWTASLAGLAVGVAVGFMNGFFVTRVGLSPFIVTLALSFMARGLAFVLSQAMPLPLNNISNSFKFIGRGVIGSTGIPFIVVLFLAVALVFDFLSRRSTVIRRIYYVGSNEKAARFSGHQREQRPHGRVHPFRCAGGHRGDFLGLAVQLGAALRVRGRGNDGNLRRGHRRHEHERR